MFRSLFRADSPLMLTMTHLTDCIFLSLFWLLACFPVVTIGAAGAALYDSVFRCFRQEEKRPWGRFWQVFKANFRPGILPGLLLAAVSWGLFRLCVALWNAAVAGMNWMFFSGGVFLAVTVLGIFSLLCPVLSRFENSFPALVKNTVYLGLANLPRAIAIGMLNALTAVLCIRYIYPLFFLPAVATLLQTYLTEPMFRPFLEP